MHLAEAAVVDIANRKNTTNMHPPAEKKKQPPFTHPLLLFNKHKPATTNNS
jgi:hypothetical protein